MVPEAWIRVLEVQSMASGVLTKATEDQIMAQEVPTMVPEVPIAVQEISCPMKDHHLGEEQWNPMTGMVVVVPHHF